MSGERETSREKVTKYSHEGRSKRVVETVLTVFGLPVSLVRRALPLGATAFWLRGIPVSLVRGALPLVRGALPLGATAFWPRGIPVSLVRGALPLGALFAS